MTVTISMFSHYLHHITAITVKVIQVMVIVNMLISLLHLSDCCYMSNRQYCSKSKVSILFQIRHLIRLVYCAVVNTMALSFDFP